MGLNLQKEYNYHEVGDLNGFNIIFVTLKHFKIIINGMALTVSAAQ